MHIDYDENVEQELFVSQRAIYQNSTNHGWWQEKYERLIPEKLALIHSEVSEALEAYRENKLTQKTGKGWFGEELADIYIRTADLAEAFNINLAEEVKKKHLYNKNRSYRHGNKKC